MAEREAPEREQIPAMERVPRALARRVQAQQARARVPARLSETRNQLLE